jgi:hypothetical protein
VDRLPLLIPVAFDKSVSERGPYQADGDQLLKEIIEMAKEASRESGLDLA